jgi:peptidoglycan/LPS O-acetylase OafA/YrhL
VVSAGLRDAGKAQRARKAEQTRKPLRFGRLQWVALLVGLFHLATAYHPIFPFDTTDPLLRICTGVCGIVMARRWQDARRFGIALVLGYGGLVVAQFAGPDRLEPVTLIYARTALSGVLIIVLSIRGAGPAPRGSAG